MRICLMVEGQEGVTWPQWAALARATEDARLDGLFRSDHYRSIGRGEPAGALDAWATLAGIAAITDTIRLGTMVSPVTFRRVQVLAKLVTTVDHISNGRAELGLGAGWYESEHEAYGFDFPPLKERMDELDRQLAEVTRQWTEAPEIQPKPVQQPRPPIIVGGTAKPRTVRAAVRYADEYNTVWPTVDEARERKQRLDEAAREADREPLRFSIMTGCVVGRDQAELQERLADYRRVARDDTPPIYGTVDEVAETLRAYEAVGVERAMLQHLHHEDPEMVAVLGEVAAQLR
ncbi:MAG TPA: LLM class flavin-dependent oxidoreductase [Gaiellaceae bacterium]|jgi:alkanesulfonate monooxygenase SsuD/methylene tetrahydromethanopterin reductase-like flavin-dependent oxidoreductase (luciferase family)|nr:LLM class flavin-dependent oxidoreductase [Gaiellaceae bacterium]